MMGAFLAFSFALSLRFLLRFSCCFLCAFYCFKVTYGGVDAIRPAEEIDAEQFIAQKSFKAKGKRLTTWKIESIEELEPTRFPEPPSEDNDEEQDGSDSENEGENLDPDAGKSEQQVIDELTGQTNLFSEKDFEEDQKDKDWLSKQ
jgi:topoisomerase IV subunit A